VKDCIPWEGQHTGAGEEGEEEGAAKCYELTATPIPHSLAPLGRRR